MQTLATVEKNPFDLLDYDVDYIRWLNGDDVVISAEAAVESPDVTFSVGFVEFTDEVVKVWVGGGASGEQSDVRVDAFTALGRVKRVCFRMRIRDC
jgi:hypothetical protein